jgi:hypothetical protein
MLKDYVILESKYNNEKRIRILKTVGDYLPHGSGIDADWALQFTTPTRIRCSSGHHCTDEFSRYDGWAYFSILIDIKDAEYFRIMFHGRESQYKAKKYDLRSYLTDTICEELYYCYGEGEIFDPQEA